MVITMPYSDITLFKKIEDAISIVNLAYLQKVKKNPSLTQ